MSSLCDLFHSTVRETVLIWHDVELLFSVPYRIRDSDHYVSQYFSEMTHGSRVVRTYQMAPQPIDNRIFQVSVLSVEEGVSFEIGSTRPNGLNP